MGKKNKNRMNKIEQSKDRFLKDNILKKDLAQAHKEYLGMDIPANYFSESKNNILKKLPMENQQKRTVFRLKPMFTYPIAATIVLLLGFTFWLQNKPSDIVQESSYVEEMITSHLNSDEFLVFSLLIDDGDMDEFVDDYILNNIVVEAEMSEQQLENILINSLLIEDSLVDSYIVKSLVDNIVL